MKNQSIDSLKIIRRNFKSSPWQDLYHKWLILSWPLTLSLFAVFFLSINLIFGGFYWLMGPEALTNGTGHFIDCFFFSVQTLGTIGYGSTSPLSLMANIVVTIEATVGIVMMAVLSGLFFAKFSQPQARLRFTQKLLLTTYNGKPVLTFRCANERANQIIDARLRLSLLRPEITSEGVHMRRFVELPLELNHIPLFAMSLTAMHMIEKGPLSDVVLNEIPKQDFELFVTMVGTDSTFGQIIHATKIYRSSDIQLGKKWVDIVQVHPNGIRVIDLTAFDDIL